MGYMLKETQSWSENKKNNKKQLAFLLFIFRESEQTQPTLKLGIKFIV